ncbi:hypothetical protein EAG18_09785 [Pseudoalteromonas sp. J010]|uniref:hypothetical protein n=1 Tax=Pseudoalteromonas sp. J010 TaxID=998465 RepID=UPI000F65437E|nr:hypothetical protein [Pseudoalteromonas sp. J010]RRS08811.1 hypothetical protein EAG18_09785 [Pseudoalteromonas sp. J010]
MLRAAIFASTLVLSLTACDVFEDSKAKVEANYLSQHQELQEVVEQIRDKGLESVQASAAAGSIAACVANNLDADPMGALISVEGALQDSANLSDLLNSIARLSDQEISIEQFPELLQQGADTVRYLKTLLEQYDLSELKQQASALLEQGQTKTQDVGAHLRYLIESCKK